MNNFPAATPLPIRRLLRLRDGDDGHAGVPHDDTLLRTMVARVLGEVHSGSCLLLRCGGSGVQPDQVSVRFFDLEPKVF